MLFELFSYDPDGNMLSDGRFTYSWNAENRLTTIEQAGKLKLEFTYDYMGRRVEKKVYSWTTDWQLDKTEKFVYDGWNVIAMVDAGNALQKSYLQGEDLSGSLQGAGGVGGLLAVTDHIGAKTYLSCMNGNGDVMAYVDSSDGSKVAEYEYSPSPDIIVKSGPKADELAQVASFSTIPWDKHLNAFIYPFRIVKDGRFLSRDPIDERGGNNLYRVTSNDTINKYDYLGLAPGEVLWIVYSPSRIKADMVENAVKTLAAVDDKQRIKPLFIYPGDALHPPNYGQITKPEIYLVHLNIARKLDDMCWDRVYALYFEVNTNPRPSTLISFYLLPLGTGDIGNWRASIFAGRIKDVYQDVKKDIPTQYVHGNSLNNWMLIGTMHEMAHALGARHLFETYGGLINQDENLKKYPTSLMRPYGSYEWMNGNYKIEEQTEKKILEAFDLE